MISQLTVIYAILALLGGALGARFTGARLSGGLYAAAAGFTASVMAQNSGSAEAGAFAAFLLGTVLVALAFRFRPLQIAAVVGAIVVVSTAGQLVLIPFSEGFAHGFSNALNHARR